MTGKVVTLWFLLTAMVLIVGAQVPLDLSGKEGTLEVVLLDSRGNPVHGAVTISANRLVDGKYDSRAKEIGTKAVLPYGTYKVSVRGSPAYPIEKTVTIKDPYQVVLIGLFVAPIELPWAGNTMHGRLPGNQRGVCHWVRLMSAVSEEEYANAPALESGDFNFENVKPGEYVIVTFGNRGICEIGHTLVLDRSNQELNVTWGK